jgi:hypothetical protein
MVFPEGAIRSIPENKDPAVGDTKVYGLFPQTLSIRPGGYCSLPARHAKCHGQISSRRYCATSSTSWLWLVWFVFSCF